MTATFKIDGQTITGLSSAARTVPASLVVASRVQITDTLANLAPGGITSFEAKWGRAADLGGRSAVTVQRIA